MNGLAGGGRPGGVHNVGPAHAGGKGETAASRLCPGRSDQARCRCVRRRTSCRSGQSRYKFRPVLTRLQTHRKDGATAGEKRRAEHSRRRGPGWARPEPRQSAFLRRQLADRFLQRGPDRRSSFGNGTKCAELCQVAIAKGRAEIMRDAWRSTRHSPSRDTPR